MNINLLFLTIFIAVPLIQGCQGYNFSHLNSSSTDNIDNYDDLPPGNDPNDGSGGGNGGGGGGIPDYKAILCNILIDKTGLYFGDESGYIAITGLTECAYNKINKIPGPCDDQVEVVILQPKEIEGIDDPDIQNTNKRITIIDQSDYALFLCISFKGVFAISAGKKKIIFVAR